MTPEFGSPRTAIVTGGARRIGEAFTRALAEDGWHVLIHCSKSVKEAEALAAELANARVVSADLAATDCADRIFSALDGLPPPGLLVNNASRFVYDDLDGFSAADWSAHMDVNARAPALLTQAFARAVPEGRGGLIVNVADAKLAFPNPDFFTYTLSKMALAGLAELSARVLAPRKIRVCGIAPAVTLVSGAQSPENFEAMHERNALGRGITPGDLVGALRYIIASPGLTGQSIVLDGGQHFLGLQRDVQFLNGE
ncbi:short-chain dehydrogenase [Tardibacter chloracetimidivorans]|uniref:Short-chain dehydrogenase n=1 Tax=Tardibacter chloracetimidivorans TaxID=1921510 RepID=A0A1L3ZRU7_9SPHN|nr:SDR family NAD(P)-dependent oxidoreductase [Tardibacter chloracetimidivorans]API58345.1 short-chain dehydrogenase [Tardibacter chloracetimidivorans]